MNSLYGSKARMARPHARARHGAVRVSELDYELPEELVAQRPPEERDGARLLVLDRDGGALSHRMVRDLPALSRPALWVVNDTRVLPARLFAYRVREGGQRGGRAELLLVERRSEEGTRERWRALGRANKKLRPGGVLGVDGSELGITILERHDDGALDVELSAPTVIAEVLERIGHVPLPPYVRRPDEDADRERYQTVFAARPGAVAAPTAGLHFSTRLLEELRRRLATASRA